MKVEKRHNGRFSDIKYTHYALKIKNKSYFFPTLKTKALQQEGFSFSGVLQVLEVRFCML